MATYLLLGRSKHHAPLTGDRFYSSADAALREAILNSIDACGRRTSDAASYHPAITVTFDEVTRTITITDNGDGMNQHDVTELFAKIGASASSVIQEASRRKYEAVGEFGIGVVSYFLVCHRFEIHTRGESGQPIGLVFTNEMFDMEKPAEETVCRQEERGTTLLLHIVDQGRFDLSH